MAEKFTGTPAITGLNVKVSSHLIEDSELVESIDGFTEKDGQWNVAPRPELLYSGADIIAYAAGRMGGADHHVWIDGSTLYDNGTSVGTVPNIGSEMEIKALNDQFLILGAAKNHIYDGDQVREQGAPQDVLTETKVDGIGTIYTSAGYFVKVDTTTASDIATISGITQASPGQVTTNSGHLLTTGTRVVLAGVTGMTEVNGNTYKITKVDATNFTLHDEISGANINTSGFTAYSGPNTGTVDPAPSDLVGRYSYYGVPTVILSDGTTLTGRPTYLTGGDSNFVTDPIKTQKADRLLFVATDTLRFQYSWPAGGAGTNFEITGTAGVDYYRGYKIYRTKSYGYDAYIVKQGDERDSDCTAGSLGRVYDYVSDGDLGAVLPYDFTDHTSPPASDFAAFAGQRLFLASGTNLHWSSFDGIEYYTLDGNTLMWDTITALGTYRDYCIVFSADRMWAVRIIGGVPDIEEIDTPVGTIYPKAMTETDSGLMFLRADGLWLFSSSAPVKISRVAFPTITNPKSVVQAGELLYVSGSDKAYIALNRGESWVWHESSYHYPYASATSGVLYAAGTFNVNEMFVGARNGGSFKTKLWGGFDTSMTYKFELDIEGESVPDMIVNGNLSSDTEWHPEGSAASFAGRRIIWTYLPRILSDYVEVECRFTGDVAAHGYRIKQER